MAHEEKKIIVIAALGARTRAIGRDNQLLWQIPEDLTRFKKLTSGHPVIMGRKTWESLPEKFRPLPGRTNIVITRDASYEAPGAHIATTIEDALTQAKALAGSEEIFIIGGQQIYEMALPFADRLYLTIIENDAGGDTFFPPYETEFTKETAREASESNGIKFAWVDLERA